MQRSVQFLVLFCTATFAVSQTESTVETCESIHCATLKALEKVILSVEGVAGKCDSDPKCLTLSCSLTRNGFPTSLIYRLLPGSRGPYAIGIELFVSGNPVINGTFSENTTVPVSLFGFSGTTEIYITQLSDGVIATVILQLAALPQEIVLNRQTIRMCRTRSCQQDCQIPTSSSTAVMVGSSVCYKCSLILIDPSYVIEWTREKNPLTPGVTTNGVTAFSNGTICIDVAQEHFGQTFVCSTPGGPFTPDFVLSEANLNPPTVSGELTLNETEELMLTCQSTSQPAVTYQWMYGGEVLSDTSTLSVPDITRSSAGVYTCIVTNVIGSLSINSTVIVQFCTKDTLSRTMNKIAATLLSSLRSNEISAECFYSLKKSPLIKCYNGIFLNLHLPPELDLPGSNPSTVRIDTSIALVTSESGHGIKIEVAVFPFDPILNGTFFENKVVNSALIGVIPIRSTINITQLPDGLELSISFNIFNLNEILLFDRVTLDVCPNTPIPTKSTSLPLPSPTPSCQKDFCQSQKVLAAALADATNEVFQAVCSGIPTDGCTLLACPVTFSVGDSAHGGSMTLAQSYCENTFQFSLAIPKVTAVFVNSTLFGTTILRSNATTVFIQTEMQSDGILLSLRLDFGSEPIVLFDELLLPVVFPLCCDAIGPTSIPYLSTEPLSSSDFVESTLPPYPSPTSSPPPTLTCMETLCQSLDSVESALLSVTGDGLSVDGHCNKSDCRELDCDLILSVTGVSQIPVDLECILIPCGEKHAFYMKMEAFGVILMEGTYSETTSIATSIFDSPGNIDVIIVPDLSSVQLTIKVNFEGIPEIVFLEDFFVPFCCPMEVAPVTNINIREGIFYMKPFLSVTWEEPISDRPITEVYVEYKEARERFSPCWITTFPTLRSAYIYDLQFGTPYEIRVKSAIRNYGNSTYSNITYHTTQNQQCPSFPIPNVRYDRVSQNMTIDRRPPNDSLDFLPLDLVTCTCKVKNIVKENCLPLDTINIDLNRISSVNVRITCEWTQFHGNNNVVRNSWIYRVPIF